MTVTGGELKIRRPLSYFVVAAVATNLAACGAPRADVGRDSQRDVASNCGSTMLQVVVDGQTVDLASCAGKAGVSPLPEITMRRGDSATLQAHGSQAIAFTVTPDSVAAVTANRISAVSVGHALVHASGSVCADGRTSCPLLGITVS